MTWLDDVGKVAEAVGASVEDAAKKAGDWVQKEGIPSLDNAARSFGQWGENEALPALRDSVDTIGSWAENEALPFIQMAALNVGQWMENDVQPHISEAMNHLKGHPEVLALIAGGSVMILAPALHQALIVAFLDALGFSSGGIAAGSIAASIQSLIGNVEAGSLFAMLQSIGAGGQGLGVIYSILQTLYALIGSIAQIVGTSTDDILERIGDTTAEFLSSLFSSTDQSPASLPGHMDFGERQGKHD